ncbi:hypothetical protein [uncultured Shewanella sp.]|uniref:hypothetical protein n=1 Tax=uncultured Shewanella sp. TaxID=173975 RepID=UPI00260DFBF4|nr:hypothetical protein [uncultured Shewanella sp.]
MAAMQYLLNQTGESAKQLFKKNISDAVEIVDELIESGKVKPPTDKLYEVLSVDYVEELFHEGEAAHGMHIPVPTRGWGPLKAKIEISALGAATLEEAIVTYGHELGHFDDSRSEYGADDYGKRILEMYKGGNN